MSKTQQFRVTPPLEADREKLEDYSSVIHRGFEDVFQDLHTHDVSLAAPSSSEGAVGDIIPVVLDGVYYLYVKFPSVGWKRVALS